MRKRSKMDQRRRFFLCLGGLVGCGLLLGAIASAVLRWWWAVAMLGAMLYGWGVAVGVALGILGHSMEWDDEGGGQDRHTDDMERIAWARGWMAPPARVKDLDRN